MGSRQKKKPSIEIYEEKRSPLAQKLTQEKFAKLIRVNLHELRGLVTYKKSFVTAKDVEEAGKVRPLSYPTGMLRVVNEKVNYQLQKIRLPSYVMSPRKGVGQKQNAQAHIVASQILKLDLKKFYPSTGRTMVARYFREAFEMHADVAGLITELLTYNGKVLYGAPATPVLVMLVHRQMFDEIHLLCEKNGAVMTLWVDNLAISGTKVPGTLLTDIRQIIASYKHRSHDIEYAHTNTWLPVTGVGIKNGELHPTNASNKAIRSLEAKLRAAITPEDCEDISNKLLSRLGSQLYILGTKSERGQRIASRMNAVRQKRNKYARQ